MTAKTHSVARSFEIYERARELIPGTSQLISRRPSRAALGVSPIYAERAKGCRIWDVDGNEYVDWMSAVGPIVLGYADDVVDDLFVVAEHLEKVTSPIGRDSYFLRPDVFRPDRAFVIEAARIKHIQMKSPVKVSIRFHT